MNNQMNQNIQLQKLIIAGAGPGDPELITVKTVRHLREADVVITDRLVSEVILEKYVRKTALILHAGKQRYKEGSTPQYIINELLVEYALQGKKVVRLKGGDVSVFSNLLCIAPQSSFSRPRPIAPVSTRRKKPSLGSAPRTVAQGTHLPMPRRRGRRRSPGGR